MSRRPFEDPTADELFYARALSIMARPTQRMAAVMRIAKLAYWLVIIVALAWLFSQIIDRGPPSTVESIVADPTKIVAGEPIRIRVTLNRHKVCDFDMEWTVIDSDREIHRFGPKSVHAPGPVGPDRYATKYDTSPNMPPGPAILRITSKAHCPGNYIQGFYPIETDLPDIPFEVVPSKHDSAPARDQ